MYSGLIKRNVASFTVISVDKDKNVHSQPVPAVTPDWEQFYQPGNGSTSIDLGEGPVTVEYSFGAMKEKEYARYYRRNMSSSGLEIRINGRALEHNLFKEVWGRERHNMYNHLLVVVDLLSDKPERLPPTRTSKNGLRQGDPRLEALYQWVHDNMADPPRNIGAVWNETDLFDMLRKNREIVFPDPKVVTTEQKVFTSLNEKVRVDMYLSWGQQLWLYEGKKDRTTVQDVYQLKMYWDGAVMDGLAPTEGVLVATSHPDSVLTMIEHMNQMKDVKGGAYSFKAKTWKEEGLDYPV